MLSQRQRVQILFLGCVLLFSQMAFSVENTSINLQEYKDANLSFLFPVNVMDAKINLSVEIPKDYKALQQDPKSTIMEFIPKSDKDPYKWSEIITLSPVIGKKVSASQYIEDLVKRMQQATNTAKVVESKNNQYEKYQDGYSIVQYQNNGRNEVVIIYGVSGPFDLATVQYALPFTKPEDLGSTVEKLKAFIKTNTMVIK